MKDWLIKTWPLRYTKKTKKSNRFNNSAEEMLSKQFERFVRGS